MSAEHCSLSITDGLASIEFRFGFIFQKQEFLSYEETK